MGTTTSRAVAPIEAFKSQLTRSKGEFAMALPSNISPEKFQRVAVTVASQNPDLLSADRKSLLGACMKCAQDGLVPDGREAALVLFKDRVQYMPMMAGLLKRARNTGDIASVSSHVVYQADEFAIEYGDEEKLIHRPKWDGDRGRAVGAYAIARLKDGSVVREWMTVAEIEKVRNVSRAKGAGPWTQWWDEMARKTVFRRLSKWLPTDAEDSKSRPLSQVAARDDDLGKAGGDADAAPIIDGVADEQGPSRLDALEGEIVPTGRPMIIKRRDKEDQMVADIAEYRAWWSNATDNATPDQLKGLRQENGALFGEYAEEHGDEIMAIQEAISERLAGKEAA